LPKDPLWRPGRPLRRPEYGAFGGLNTAAFGGLNTAAFGGLKTAGRSPADRMVDACGAERRTRSTILSAGDLYGNGID